MIKNIFQFKNKYLEKIFTVFVLLGLSFLIMSITFVFSSSKSTNMPMFSSYFNSAKLMLMNFIPIFIFMTFVYLLSNRLWVGFLSTWALFTMFYQTSSSLPLETTLFHFLAYYTNQRIYGDETKYEIHLTRNMIILFIGLIMITVILKILMNCKLVPQKNKMVSFRLYLRIEYNYFGKPYFDYETCMLV